MKKIALLSAAACVLMSVPAYARVNLNLDVGVAQPYYAQPAYYAEPAPAYVVAPSYPEYYRHRHYYHPRGWHR